jgi:hypothetical protein
VPLFFSVAFFVAKREHWIHGKGKRMKKTDEQPFSVQQLASAMQALGMYGGENTEEEHEAEAEHFGGMKAYEIVLANALLGIVEGNALLLDSIGVTREQMQTAHQQALKSSGVEDVPGKLLQFLRWKTLRVGSPLREIAQRQEVGPLPLSAAHAAEALQLLLGVCVAGQNLTSATDPDAMTIDLKKAREALKNALVNLEIMFKLLDQVKDLYS